MAKNIKQSSPNVGTKAAQTLSNKNSSDIARSLAGSVVAQSGTQKQTGAKMETKASKVLTSDKYSESTKALAGSVLSQSNKKR